MTPGSTVEPAGTCPGGLDVGRLNHRDAGGFRTT